MARLIKASHDIYSIREHPVWRRTFPAAVQRQDGLLPVFIHPFFNQYESDTNFSSLKDVSQKIQERDNVNVTRLENRGQTRSELTEVGYLLRLWRFLATTGHELLVIGEYGPFMGATIDLFRKMGYRRLILHYDTADGDPRPATANYPELGSAINILDPKIIAAAGQNLWVTKYSSGRIDTGGCVPAFLSDIVPHLDKKRKPRVLLSPIAYPHWKVINRDQPVFPLKK